MELTLVAKNTTLTDAIKDYAVKRLSKLDRRFREPVPVQLEIRKESTRREDQRYVAEVTVLLKGSIIRSEERGPSPYAAIDIVEQTIDRRIRRWKAQFERRRREASRFQQGIAAQLAEHENTEANLPGEQPEADRTGTGVVNGRVVKTKFHSVAPMSVEDAAEQMELLGHNFYVFLNRETKQINVVYSRQDGNYGLIIPEPGV